MRVATKYPNLTREFLFSKGVTQFKLVPSLGATEVYPFTGSSEILTDITSTGETLRANNLRILKDGQILKSQACLFVNRSMKKSRKLKKIALNEALSFPSTSLEGSVPFLNHPSFRQLNTHWIH